MIAAGTAASMLMGIAGCNAEGTDTAAEAVLSESVAAAEIEEEPEQTLCKVEEFGYCIESYPQFYVGSDSWEDGVWSDDMAPSRSIRRASPRAFTGNPSKALHAT